MFGMVTALVVQEPSAAKAAGGTGAALGPATVRAAATAAGSTALMCRIA
jgi:hypothetical protein